VLFVALVGIAGWLLAGLALLIRRPLLLAWGLAGVGAEYATFLRLRGGSVDSRAALVAAVLLLAAELAFLSLAGGLAGADKGLIVRTAGGIAAAVASAALLADLLLVVSGSASAGLALEAIGVGAAVCAVAIVVRLAAR